RFRYSDAHDVPRTQAEAVGGHDAGAGHQESSLRKTELSTEIAGQLSQAALHLRARGLALEHRFTSAANAELDRHVGERLLVTQHDGRADGAAAVVHLGLRQVERVVALDVARGDVVARAVADDLEIAIQDQRELGLRHVPLGVAPHPNVHAVAHGTYADGLEEQLRAVGDVHLLIDVFYRRFVRARLATAFVGNAARPNFLVVFDRRQQRPQRRLRAGEAIEKRRNEVGRELEQ